MQATPSFWQRANLAAIAARLAPLRALPDGTLYDARAGLLHIRIIKQGSQIAAYFVASNGALDGPMSRIDLEHPLRLLAPYTQALLLALLWRPAPARACILGFAGGRMSLALHHHFPDLLIDNVEIDPAFATLAPEFFGIAFDERQTLHLIDARAFLAGSAQRYDFILMDAFADDSDELDHLATAQFYALCAERLARGGVFGANILRSDALAAAKIRTLRDKFAAMYMVELKHSLVVFGLPEARRDVGLAQRAAELAARHGFDFPFAERAAELRPARAIDPALLSELRRAAPLDDSAL